VTFSSDLPASSAILAWPVAVVVTNLVVAWFIVIERSGKVETLLE